MKISIVIVSYRVKIHLQQCLQSVEKALQNYSSEIIVVDNASNDGTVSDLRPLFPNVNFIASDKNLGFAKANNLGVQKANGKYVLILNPDTVLPEYFFEKTLHFAESHFNFGALGPRLVNANGQFHPESKRNIPSPQNTFGKLFGLLFDKDNHPKNYYKTHIAETENAECEILVGACLFLKRSVYEEIGGFDERYFMYGEDIDLCYSLILKDYTNYYTGEIPVLHYKGESTRKDKHFLKVFFRAMALYMKKYYRSKNYILYILMRLGLIFRHALTRLAFKFSPQQQDEVKIDDLTYWQNNPEGNHLILDGNKMSNQEILNLIITERKPDRKFFIIPQNMEVIVGDGIIFPLEEFSQTQR